MSIYIELLHIFIIYRYIILDISLVDIIWYIHIQNHHDISQYIVIYRFFQDISRYIEDISRYIAIYCFNFWRYITKIYRYIVKNYLDISRYISRYRDISRYISWYLDISGYIGQICKICRYQLPLSTLSPKILKKWFFLFKEKK